MEKEAVKTGLGENFYAAAARMFALILSPRWNKIPVNQLTVKNPDQTK